MEAYRRLFPVAFLERHLGESVRIDARRLREARPTTVALGAVSSAHGSALVRLGDTVIRPPFPPPRSPMFPVLPVSRSSIVRRIVFAGHARVGQARGDVAPGRAPRRRIRRFVSPLSLLLRIAFGFYSFVDVDVFVFCVAVEFHMPPICSPLVRPGRSAEAAPVISKALEDVLMRFFVSSLNSSSLIQ